MSEINESAYGQLPSTSAAPGLIECDEISNTENFDYSLESLSKLSRVEMMDRIKLESLSLHRCESKIEKELIVKEDEMEMIKILSNRINDLYEILFKTYEIDVNVVSDYIKFGSSNKVITSKFRNELNELMESFRVDPEVYISGASYIFNDCNDIISARRYLTNGINFHKSYQRLFLKEIEIELKYFNSTEGASFEVVLNKYNNLITRFKNDLNLHLTLVENVFSYSVVGKLHSIVIRDMLNKYKLKEKMWQKLAKLYWKGFNYHFESEHIDICEDKLTCIKKCISIYENTLEKNLFPDNQQILWNYFLDMIIEISDDSNMQDKTINDFMMKTINDTFHLAFKNKTMILSKYFIFWADHTDEDTELNILQTSVQLIRQDKELWLKLLRSLLYRDLYLNAWEVFQEAIHILKNDGIQLWQIMELYLLNTDDEKMIQFYELAAIGVPYKDICLKFRSKYLEWSTIRLDMSSTRRIFQKIKDLDPPCKTVYKDMIKAELYCGSGRKRVLTIRNLYSEACNKFGVHEIDIWVDCIKFEYIYGLHSCAEIIYQVGLKMVDPNLKNSLEQAKKEIDKEYKKKDNQVIEISDDDDDDDDY
ncbi:uncharacterized protein LOC112692978 [Sipha flava]|uniref:Uncharacterized protein LOC112692978 n=1 Tax=Sipha flava TaxID=143950 RepID=A0A2S2QX32_9HEMI|nr:uncharacterized protein LOC112692978 [Sipha flava]